MTLTLAAPNASISSSMFLVVLFAAVGHAVWNFLAKKTQGNIGVMCLSVPLSGLATAPLVLYSVVWDTDNFVLCWTSKLYYCIISGVLHAAFMRLLGICYQTGHISTVYPVSRGAGIIFLAILSSFIWSQNKIGVLGVVGILIISCGILMIGLHGLLTEWALKALDKSPTAAATSSAVVPGSGAHSRRQSQIAPTNAEHNGSETHISITPPPIVVPEPESDSDADHESQTLLSRSSAATHSNGDSAASDSAATITPHTTLTVAVGSSPAIKPAPVHHRIGYGSFSFMISESVLVSLLSILVGAFICTYTIVDHEASQHLHPMVYLPGIFIFSGICLMPYVTFYVWEECKSAWYQFKWELIIISFGSPYCYFLFLYAYASSHVAYVAAVRESAVLFGAMLGIFVLKEPAGFIKWGGIFAILAGLICIRISSNSADVNDVVSN